MPERMVSLNFQIDEETHERLRQLSEKTRVPMGNYMREGFERVLQLAEAQHRTITQVLEREAQEAEDGE